MYHLLILSRKIEETKNQEKSKKQKETEFKFQNKFPLNTDIIS